MRRLSICSSQAGYTPLHTACHFGQIAMIRFLLECAAPIDAQTKVVLLSCLLLLLLLLSSLHQAVPV